MLKRNYYLFFLFFLVLSSCENYLPGFDFKSFDKTLVSELADAVKNENIKQIEFLVKSKKLPIDYLDPKFGHSLLMLSVANNLEKSTSKLLELGANPNLKSRKLEGVEVNTAMFIACSDYLNQNNCKTNILNSLIRGGGNVNDTINVSFVGADYLVSVTPLMEASKGKCLNIVKFIVENGANINNYDYKEGQGPITNAIIQDRMEILRYLIIEKKATIPKYCFVVQAYNETKRQEYTVTEFLKKKKYRLGSENAKIKDEILNYLKENKFE